VQAPPAAAPPSPPPPAPVPITPAPINLPTPYTHQQLSPHGGGSGGGGIQLPMPSGVINGGGAVRIKPEPDVDVQIKSEPVNRESEAAARAAQNLKSAFGVRASGSIQAIHRAQPGKPGQPGQPAGPQQGQMPYPQPLLPQMPQYPPQTDGAGDEADEDGSETEEMDELDTVMMRCGPDGSLEELGRVDIDRMLHKRMMAHAQAMEGGGLMVPLKKVSRRTRRSEAAARSSLARPRRGSGVGKAQLDGGDYDDDDEDAINSDLDDPNEFTEDEDEEDDQLTNAMLCMYDKVQRVKNKWKCTLKDGILTTNKKEYLFHKANAELEF
jgi:transcription initiation factor TFIIA large subunit